jgi:hypothetical protein
MIPVVSVVMAVYNAEKYVAEAVESILNQTLGDFEFIIVDDGSTDATARILTEIAARDGRVKLLRNDHGGVVAAANAGCRVASASYLARMDADDVSLPTRLERQLHFLRAHPEVGVVGSNVVELHEDGTTGAVWQLPAEPRLIRWSLMFRNCIANPTTMMRREVFEQAGPYRSEAAEDYGLWARASPVTEIANLPEVLLQYRIRPDSLTRTMWALQLEHSTDIQQALIADLLQVEVSRLSIELLQGRVDALGAASLCELETSADLLAATYRAYARKTRLAYGERSDIALDVLRSLDRLATFATAFSRLSAFRIRARCMRFAAPALLKRDNANAIARRAWSMATRGVSRRKPAA